MGKAGMSFNLTAMGSHEGIRIEGGVWSDVFSSPRSSLGSQEQLLR